MYSKLGRKISGGEFDLRIKDFGFIRVGEYINSNTSIVFKCKLCDREMKSKPKSINSLVCKCLNSQKRYIELISNKDIELIGKYTDMRTKTDHKCLNCELVFSSTPKSVKYSKIGCPSCSGKIFSISKYKSILPSDIILVSDEYTGSNKYLSHKCLKCEYMWDTKPNYIIHMGCGCPRCSMSKGEKEISNFLILNKIDFTSEYSVKIGLNTYKFDFYLPKLDIYIEYDGIQHFRPIEYFGGDNQFIKIMENDSIKDKWISDSGNKLVRISYKQSITDELNKLLIQI